MSLSKLSTELDSIIAGHIGSGRDLAALARVSKYYRDIAEEHLYTSITSRKAECWDGSRRMRQLLYTLVKQPNLALRIKHVAVYDDTVDPDYIPDDTDDYDDFSEEDDDSVSEDGDDDDSEVDEKTRAQIQETLDHKNLVLDAIDRALQYVPQAESIDQIDYQMRKYNYAHSWPEGFAMELIICMATNLETLSVCKANDANALTRAILTLPWTLQEGSPFSKIKELCICSCRCAHQVPLIVLPTVRSLTVRHWHREFPKHWQSSLTEKPIIYQGLKPEESVLETLRLDSMMIDPGWVDQTIRSGWFANLRSLEVTNVLPTEPRPLDDPSWRDLGDMSTLIQALGEFTPNLEKLVWTKYVPTVQTRWTRDLTEPWAVEKIESFRGLKHLKELTIETNLVMDTDGPSGLNWLQGMRKFMPDSLEVMTFASLPLGYVGYFVGQHFLVRMRNPKDNVPIGAIERLAAGLPAKHVQLRLIMESPNEDHEDSTRLLEFPWWNWINTLRFLADELKKLGITFEIFREAGVYEGAKLIIGPGFTAPFPHSVRPGVNHENYSSALDVGASIGDNHPALSAPDHSINDQDSSANDENFLADGEYSSEDEDLVWL